MKVLGFVPCRHKGHEKSCYYGSQSHTGEVENLVKKNRERERERIGKDQKS